MKMANAIVKIIRFLKDIFLTIYIIIYVVVCKIRDKNKIYYDIDGTFQATDENLRMWNKKQGLL